MHSSLKRETQENEHLLDTDRLRDLLAAQKISLLGQVSGGNSKVFCVEADGCKWAVKSYPPYAPLKRDRLLHEIKAYQLLNREKIKAVPQLKTHSERERLLIISWIEGQPIDSYHEEDITQAIDFIREIAELNLSQEALTILPAAEACLSLNVIINQINNRLAQLRAVEAEEPELKAFLSKEFKPLFDQAIQAATENYRKDHIDIDEPLPSLHCSLIPADFGFHNAIRALDGKLYFFDFDYFGWDDPVKLLADILWHPKMRLSESEKQQFIQGISAIYAKDPLFRNRFAYTLQLFGLRWVLILLNEFLPSFWQNRMHAQTGHQQMTQTEAKFIQLARAKALLKRCITTRIPL